MSNTTTYKQTAIGLIPIDWEVKKIKEIGDVSSGGTPDTGKESYWNGDINWCTPTDITALKNKFLGNTKTKITEEGLKNSSAKILPPHSIIVCTRATIGKAAINTVPMSTNQGFKNIIPKKIDADFLYYKIISEEHSLVRIASGSTFLEVSKTDFDNFHISITPLPEQQKIAAILSTWDAAIDNCKAIIEELKLRNRGLMKIVFDNKYLSNNGGFEKLKLENITSKIGDGLHGTPNFVKSSEYFFINGNNIANYCLTITDNTKCISKEEFNLLKKELNDNTILLSINGTIGNLSFYNNENVALGKSIAYINCKNSVSKYYVFYWLNSDYTKNFIEQELTGSTIRNLSLKSIRAIPVKLPSIKTQNKIVGILNSSEKELNQYQQKLETLQLQKKGLMHQLLTGKTRVRI